MIHLCVRNETKKLIRNVDKHQAPNTVLRSGHEML